jgi:putative glycosyltransferase (TIGR04372 family)
MLAVMTKQTRILNLYLSTKLGKLQKLGFKWLLKEVSSRGLKEMGWLLLLPLAILLHFLGFRRVPVLVQHIGHLTSEPDTFIKAQQLGFVPPGKYFMVASSRRVANAHLLTYWRQYLKVFTQPVVCIFLEMLTRRYFALYKSEDHQFNVFGGTQNVYRINQLWGKRPALLRLSKEDQSWADSKLQELGLAKEQWFVCLHVREGGFLPQNETLHDFRNAKVTHTLLAVEEIVRRGGKVIRMGDATMQPFPPTEGLIDYALHPLKSDRMDVILCAKARFFLGCSSGLAFLSMNFGVPIAHVNMIPVDTLGFRYYDLSIPKLVWSHQLNRYLTYKELFHSEQGSYIFSHQYKEAGLRADENSPEDILQLTLEMLDRLEGRFIETEEDCKRHQSYLALFRPGHYSYGADSRVGLAFLKKYGDFIDA